METLIEKIRIIDCSGARGSVNLDNLINFPQVIIPPKFKAPEFVKYDSTRDPCTYLRMFYKKMAHYRDNHPLLCQIFPDSLTGPTATWYVRLENTSSWREKANAFLVYYQFNMKISPDRKVL